MIILTKYRIYLPNRNLLFKLDETNLDLYSHIINSSINFILVKNNSNRLLIIYKKYYLGSFIKISYVINYYINIDLTDPTTRLSNK